MCVFKVGLWAVNDTEKKTDAHDVNLLHLSKTLQCRLESQTCRNARWEILQQILLELWIIHVHSLHLSLSYPPVCKNDRLYIFKNQNMKLYCSLIWARRSTELSVVISAEKNPHLYMYRGMKHSLLHDSTVKDITSADHLWRNNICSNQRTVKGLMMQTM